jgi:hypothetical protein
MRGNVSGLLYNTTNNQTKGNKMTTQSTLEVGQTYTTSKSGVTGTITAIDNHPSGVTRLALDVNGTERWTSVSN